MPLKVEKESRLALIKLLFSKDSEWYFYSDKEAPVLQENDWNGKYAFEKIFSLTLFIFDDLWYSNNSNYLLFNIVIEKTMKKLQFLLKRIDSLEKLENLIDEFNKK